MSEPSYREQLRMRLEAGMTVPAELAAFYGPGARSKAEYEPFMVRTIEVVQDSPAARAKRRRATEE